MAIENAICLGPGTILAVAGDAFFDMIPLDPVIQFTTPGTNGITIDNAGNHPYVTEIDTTIFDSAIRVNLDAVIDPGTLVVHIPGNVPGVRGIAGGQMCPGEYQIQVP